MPGDDLVIFSVMFCYFLDRGPSSIDFFLPGEIIEDPDLTAVRLMTKSTAMVKGDSSQQVEQSITNQLSGPDIYPVDPNYRMVWYNWLIANRFSNDSRIKQTGSMAGIYCIYSKKKEEVIRSSLKIIEKDLWTFSSEVKSIDDVIKRKFNLSPITKITQNHFNDFLKNSDTDVITKKISQDLNERVKTYTEDQRRKYVPQTATFKIILQKMVFKQGTAEEIFGQAEKRSFWDSLIKNLDFRIKARFPKMVIKKINNKEMKEIYHLVAGERLWADLPLGKIPQSIQSQEIGDFFFYYWLIYHKLLNRKKVLKFYQERLN